jgi:hypothetical protein
MDRVQSQLPQDVGGKVARPIHYIALEHRTQIVSGMAMVLLPARQIARSES